MVREKIPSGTDRNIVLWMPQEKKRVIQEKKLIFRRQIF
jgi:hypothetical protein